MKDSGEERNGAGESGDSIFYLGEGRPSSPQELASVKIVHTRGMAW